MDSINPHGPPQPGLPVGQQDGASAPPSGETQQQLLTGWTREAFWFRLHPMLATASS